MKNATSRRWVLALWLTLGFVQGSKSWARDVSASRNDPVVRAYELLEGTLTFRFDEDALHALGIGFVPQGAVAADATGNVIIFEVDPSASPRFELSGTGFERLSGGPIVSCGACSWIDQASGWSSGTCRCAPPRMAR